MSGTGVETAGVADQASPIVGVVEAVGTSVGAVGVGGVVAAALVVAVGAVVKAGVSAAGRAETAGVVYSPTAVGEATVYVARPDSLVAPKATAPVIAPLSSAMLETAARRPRDGFHPPRWLVLRWSCRLAGPVSLKY